MFYFNLFLTFYFINYFLNLHSSYISSLDLTLWYYPVFSIKLQSMICLISADSLGTFSCDVFTYLLHNPFPIFIKFICSTSKIIYLLLVFFFEKYQHNREMIRRERNTENFSFIFLILNFSNTSPDGYFTGRRSILRVQ